MEQKQPIDWITFKDLLGTDDRAVWESVFNVWEKAFSERLEELKSAVKAEDKSAAKAAAHAAKGEARQIAALHLGDLLAGIEKLVYENRWEEAGKMVSEISLAHEEVVKAILSWKKSKQRFFK